MQAPQYSSLGPRQQRLFRFRQKGKSLQRIIDAHVHLSEREDDGLIRFARMNGLRYTLDELLGTMERYGIVRGLLLSPPLQGAASLPNDKIITLCTRSGGVLAPVGTVGPTAKDVKGAGQLAGENKRGGKALKGRVGFGKGSAGSSGVKGVYGYAECGGVAGLFHTR